MEPFHLERGESYLNLLKVVPPGRVSYRLEPRLKLRFNSFLERKYKHSPSGQNYESGRRYFSLKLGFLRLKMVSLRLLHSPVGLIGI